MKMEIEVVSSINASRQCSFEEKIFLCWNCFGWKTKLDLIRFWWHNTGYKQCTVFQVMCTTKLLTKKPPSPVPCRFGSVIFFQNCARNAIRRSCCNCMMRRCSASLSKFWNLPMVIERLYYKSINFFSLFFFSLCLTVVKCNDFPWTHLSNC